MPVDINQDIPITELGISAKKEAPKEVAKEAPKKEDKK